MKVTGKNSCTIMLLAITAISLATMSILPSISVNVASAQTDSRGPVNVNISPVGVQVFNRTSEFGPITIGTASINNTGRTNTIYLSADKILQYRDRNVFPLDLSKLMTGKMNVTLKDHQTFLSNKLQSTKPVNYVGVSIKTISTKNSKDNHAGIIWNMGNKEYYAFLRPNSIHLYIPDKGEVASAPAVHPVGKWDTLRVAYIDGDVHVILNNLDKIAYRAGIIATPPTTTTPSSNQLKPSPTNATTTTTTTTTTNECSKGLAFIIPCG
jgi:hypothetical protein